MTAPVNPHVRPRLFGAKLRVVRTRRHLTQRELAVNLGFQTQTAVSRLEAGQREPSVDLLCVAAQVLGVALDFLVLDSIPLEASEQYLQPTPPAPPLRGTAFGPNLRTLRLQHHLLQADLARELGVTQMHISNLESGRKQPSLALLLRLVERFPIRVSALFAADAAW